MPRGPVHVRLYASGEDSHVKKALKMTLALDHWKGQMSIVCKVCKKSKFARVAVENAHVQKGYNAMKTALNGLRSLLRMTTFEGLIKQAPTCRMKASLHFCKARPFS